jgi:hypothetical protein
LQNTSGISHRRIALYTVIVFVLCSLFTFTCTPAPSTPSQPVDTEPEVEVPDTSPDTSVQQEDSRWKADNIITQNEYDSLGSYDNGNYEIAWASDDEYIYVYMRAKTDGFVAIGIQPDTTMQQADIIIGTVENGKATVLDEFSAQAFGPHKPDTDFEGGTDDIIDYSATENGGYTIVEFKRKLDTGDIFDHSLDK